MRFPAIFATPTLAPFLAFTHASAADGEGDFKIGPDYADANQRKVAPLKGKGCHYRYVFSKASGRVDGRVAGKTFPEVLMWLWCGWPWLGFQDD